jgi:hypothetical protein
VGIAWPAADATILAILAGDLVLSLLAVRVVAMRVAARREALGGGAQAPASRQGAG